MHVLLYGITLGNNFGCPSLLNGAIALIRRSCPEARITLLVRQKTDMDLADRFDCTFLSYPYRRVAAFLLDSLGTRIGRYPIEPKKALFWHTFLSADTVANIAGISFYDNSTAGNQLVKGIRLAADYAINYAAKKAGIRSIKAPGSIGPLISAANRKALAFTVKYCLDLVCTRESKSYDDVCAQTGLPDKVICGPDMANIMRGKPRRPAFVPDEAPIGISTSSQIQNKWAAEEPYLDCLASLVKHILDTTSRDVALIPNEYTKNVNDGTIAEEIRRRFIDSNRVILVPADQMNAIELKTRIAECEVVVGSRYHCAVAALSSAVPFLCIGWHHKYEELLGLYGMRQYLISEKDCSSSLLIAQFEMLYTERERLRDTLRKAYAAVEKRIYDSGAVMFPSEKTEVNVAGIVGAGLCRACGSCVGICPAHALDMRFSTTGFLHAHVDKDACMRCGKCRLVCPCVAGTADIPPNMKVLQGNALSCQIGYALDPEIRRQGQSGGVVTALLAYLLDTDGIDGAIVNRFAPQSLSASPFFCATKGELLSAAGSQYTQSAVNECFLRHQDKRLAVVTLGCQTEGITRLVCQRHAKAPEFVIGLICNGQHSRLMNKELITMAGIGKNEKVQNIRIRDKALGGWPGNTGITTQEGKHTLDSAYRKHGFQIYENYSCLFCWDKMNVNADVVVGDPWGVSGDVLSDGYSVVIARTEKGRALLERAQAAGSVSLRDAPLANVLEGQFIHKSHLLKYSAASSMAAVRGWIDAPGLIPYPESTDRFQLRKETNRMLHCRTNYFAGNEQGVQEENRRYEAILRKEKRIAPLARILRKLTKPGRA